MRTATSRPFSANRRHRHPDRRPHRRRPLLHRRRLAHRPNRAPPERPRSPSDTPRLSNNWAPKNQKFAPPLSPGPHRPRLTARPRRHPDVLAAFIRRNDPAFTVKDEDLPAELDADGVAALAVIGRTPPQRRASDDSHSLNLYGIRVPARTCAARTRPASACERPRTCPATSADSPRWTSTPSPKPAPPTPCPHIARHPPTFRRPA